MQRRTRIVMIVLGLLLVILSLAALSFAFQAGNSVSADATLAPTLFTLPPGGLP